jgi:hypothetical protein
MQTYGYPPFSGTVIAAPRRNVLPESNTVVVNLTVSVPTEPIGKMIKTEGGEEIFALVPQSDIHDVSVWNPELQATALGLVSGQALIFTARSIKGGKPYAAEDGSTRYTTKIRAASIIPGAVSTKRDRNAAPATAPAAAPAAAAAAATGAKNDDDLNF